MRPWEEQGKGQVLSSSLVLTSETPQHFAKLHVPCYSLMNPGGEGAENDSLPARP